jgi:hypothetical protein
VGQINEVGVAEPIEPEGTENVGMGAPIGRLRESKAAERLVRISGEMKWIRSPEAPRVGGSVTAADEAIPIPE